MLKILISSFLWDRDSVQKCLYFSPYIIFDLGDAWMVVDSRPWVLSAIHDSISARAETRAASGQLAFTGERAQVTLAARTHNAIKGACTQTQIRTHTNTSLTLCRRRLVYVSQLRSQDTRCVCLRRAYSLAALLGDEWRAWKRAPVLQTIICVLTFYVYIHSSDQCIRGARRVCSVSAHTLHAFPGERAHKNNILYLADHPYVCGLRSCLTA